MKKYYVLFCLIPLLLVSLVNGSPLDATLANGDFEGAFMGGVPQDWVVTLGDPNDLAESNEGIGGSKCVEFNGTSNDLEISQNLTGVIVGGDLTFQVYYNTTDYGAAWGIAVSILCYNASYEYIGMDYGISSDPTSGFEPLSATYSNIPPNTVITTLEIRVGAFRRATTSRAFFQYHVTVDDASISGSAVSVPEFDGVPLVVTASFVVMALIILRKK